ncbi:MAG: hypothetical protein V4730_12000 [Pseudomonadota bacterium]
MTTTVHLDGERALFEETARTFLSPDTVDQRLVWDDVLGYEDYPVALAFEIWQAARSKPEGAEKNQDHLAACGRDRVQVPLTDEQIRALWLAGKDHGDDWLDVQSIVRDVEAAHGIKDSS